eukprot:jgi/Tetstr1/425199/TSEL_015660.t1
MAGTASPMMVARGADPSSPSAQLGSPSSVLPSVKYRTKQDFSDIKEIYRGRHSIVWTCVCKQTSEPVILKAYVKANMQLRHYQQVKREIVLMQEIQFTGVVIFKGTFEDSGHIFIVQEDCKKGDLFKRVLRAGGILPERVVITDIILPMLVTLDHLHKRSIIHRDIKPENIFFTGSGALKLGDFGLSINMIRERPKSRVGTLDYMAPEVISLPNHEQRIAMETKNGTKDTVYYGPAVDIWAVGVLAYELLAGRPPFEVEEERETAMRIMYHTDIEFPCYVSRNAQEFILTALKKAPGDRPGASALCEHAWLKPHLAKFMSTSAPKELPARAAIPASPTPSPKTPGKSALMRGPSVKRVGFSPDALTASMNNVSISSAAGGKPGDGGVKLPPIAKPAGRPAGKTDLKRTKTLSSVDAFKGLHGLLNKEKMFSGAGDTSTFGLSAADLVPPPAVSPEEAKALQGITKNKTLPLRNRNKTIGANMRDDRNVLQALNELENAGDDTANPSSVAEAMPSTIGGRVANYLKSRLARQ